MSMSTVTIDNTWLSGKTPPYDLNQADTKYTLGVDVTVTDPTFFGQVFTLSAKNVYLDLSTHTVRVNGELWPQVTDNRLYRRVSEYSARAIGTSNVVTFGGNYANGDKQKPVVDPASPEWPLVVPWADSK